ncbi:hypothetical protein GMSM_37630 [Geomonas sp. Red276]
MNIESTILIVDDEPHVISALGRELAEEPYQLQGSGGGAEALRMMEHRRFKVVISDEMMPGMEGAEFLSRVKKLYPETVRIMLTGHASLQSAMRAVNSGEIYRFFTKPWNEAELKMSLRSAVEKYDLEEENRRLLKTVRRQSQELRYLERSYPGISTIRRDADNAIHLDLDLELSDEELAEVVDRCNRY